MEDVEYMALMSFIDQSELNSTQSWEKIKGKPPFRLISASNYEAVLNKLRLQGYLDISKSERPDQDFVSVIFYKINQDGITAFSNETKKMEAEVKRQRLQDELLENTISTNKSVRDTNTYQKNFGNRSLLLGLISVAFIGLTLLKEYRDKTESKVQELSLKSDSLRIELKNIQSSLERIVNSIRQGNTDTSPSGEEK